MLSLILCLSTTTATVRAEPEAASPPNAVEGAAPEQPAERTPEQIYQELFAAEEPRLVTDAPAFALRLIQAASMVNDAPDLQLYLLDKAYEFGLRHPTGLRFALDATRRAIQLDPAPERLVEKEDQLLAVYARRYSLATGQDRIREGDAYARKLLEIADRRMGIGQYDDSLNLYRKLLTLTQISRSVDADLVRERIRFATGRSAVSRQVELMRSRLETSETTQPAVARRLAWLLAIEMGLFEDAARYARDAEEPAMVEGLALAQRHPTLLTEPQALQLAEWLADQVPEASEVGKAITLRTALRAFDRYLALHTVRDELRLKAQFKRDLAEQSLRELPDSVRALAAQINPDPAPLYTPGPWTDVLARAQFPRDMLAGKAVKRAAGLMLTGQPSAALRIPVAVVGEYEFTIRTVAHSSFRGMQIVFPVAGRPARALLYRDGDGQLAIGLFTADGLVTEAGVIEPERLSALTTPTTEPAASDGEGSTEAPAVAPVGPEQITIFVRITRIDQSHTEGDAANHSIDTASAFADKTHRIALRIKDRGSVNWTGQPKMLPTFDHKPLGHPLCVALTDIRPSIVLQRFALRTLDGLIGDLEFADAPTPEPQPTILTYNTPTEAQWIDPANEDGAVLGAWHYGPLPAGAVPPANVLADLKKGAAAIGSAEARARRQPILAEPQTDGWQFQLPQPMNDAEENWLLVLVNSPVKQNLSLVCDSVAIAGQMFVNFENPQAIEPGMSRQFSLPIERGVNALAIRYTVITEQPADDGDQGFAIHSDGAAGARRSRVTPRLGMRASGDQIKIASAAEVDRSGYVFDADRSWVLRSIVRNGGRPTCTVNARITQRPIDEPRRWLLVLGSTAASDADAEQSTTFAIVDRQLDLLTCTRLGVRRLEDAQGLDIMVHGRARWDAALQAPVIDVTLPEQISPRFTGQPQLQTPAANGDDGSDTDTVTADQPAPSISPDRPDQPDPIDGGDVADDAGQPDQGTRPLFELR